jgi:hypothetical protein
MKRKPKPSQDLEDTLAEGIAAVMASGESVEDLPMETAEMADLFLGELNRLWAEPLPEGAA